MTLIMLVVALPIQAQVKQVEELQLPPITGISHSGARASGVGEWDGGFVDGRS